MKIGLFGTGLNTYWPQFPGLKERLSGYQDRVHAGLRGEGVEVVDAGLIDTPQAAAVAGEGFRRDDVELIFLYIATYALSSTVLPVVQRARVPVVVLNLQPTKSIDYDWFNGLGDRGAMTGEWLANCQACCAPEIACVFNRAQIPFHLVTGTLDDPTAWEQIKAWVDAAQVASAMRANRVGLLGHYYGGMLDVYSDMTQQSSAFGNHFEIVEMCELRAIRDSVTEQEIDAEVERFEREFSVQPQCEGVELRRAASTSAALGQLTSRHDLGSLAYYYEGWAGNDYEDIVTSLIAGTSLLTGHGVPVAGEYEIKNVQAMKILDLLGAGGSFSEFYGIDFEHDVVLIGHDGPGHIGLADGPVKLVPLPVYHGKPGKGLSIEMRVRAGPITILSVVQDGLGKLKLLAAEGEAVDGPILQIGNTNSRCRFPGGARVFFDRWCGAGPAHHCAIGVGHLGDTLDKVASLFGIECIRI